MPGFRGVLDLTGVTVGGAVQVVSPAGGLDVLQLQGVWLAAPDSAPAASPSLSMLQYQGVWISGAFVSVAIPPLPAGGSSDPPRQTIRWLSGLAETGRRQATKVRVREKDGEKISKSVIPDKKLLVLLAKLIDRINRNN